MQIGILADAWVFASLWECAKKWSGVVGATIKNNTMLLVIGYALAVAKPPCTPLSLLVSTWSWAQFLNSSRTTLPGTRCVDIVGLASLGLLSETYMREHV